jgi:DDE superfamily endonuclease
MDAGIIRTFKAYYKRLYLREVIHNFESNVKNSGKINVYQAIRFIKTAWNMVTMDTIKNCWKHTGILPVEHLESLQMNDNSETHDEITTTEHDIRDAIQESLAADTIL